MMSMTGTRLAGAAFAMAIAGGAHAQIVVGQTAGFTGTVAATVKESSEGARLYIDAVNARGGVNGQKIDLVSLDDQFDPKRAAANARTLIVDRRAVALFPLLWHAAQRADHSRARRVLGAAGRAGHRCDALA